MWRRQTQVQIQLLTASNPEGALNVPHCTLEKISKHRRYSVPFLLGQISVSSDATQLD